MKNMFLLERYKKLHDQLDVSSLINNTAALYECARKQTFSCYHAEAEKTVELLKAANIPNVEKIALPADGKTAYQDKIMPIGWEASTGKLSVKQAAGLPENFVLADFQRNAFELIKGSVGTLSGGEDIELIDYQSVLAGADATGKLVVAPLAVRPPREFFTQCLDLGARGYITDFARNYEALPEGVQWCNGYSEHNNWHTVADDREFIAFCLSPVNGRKLRTAMAQGKVICHMESDARRFESTVDIVTACIPGKSSKEFWMLAHLYEPLSNDNSAGVAAVIETAKVIMSQGVPEYSLRLVFAMEHYGFAAYHALRGNRNLSDEVIGGCNFDAMYLQKDWMIYMSVAGAGTPTYCNLILKELTDTLAGEENIPVLEYRNSFVAMYYDDSFLSDSTTGVPTMWPIRNHPDAWWHNSAQTMDYIDKQAFSVGTSINLTLVDACINPTREVIGKFAETAVELMAIENNRTVGSAKEHLQHRLNILAGDIATLDERFAGEKKTALEKLREKFTELSKDADDTIPHSPWRDYAADITVSRTMTGLPFDLANLPIKKRRFLPGSVLYGPLAAMLANCDGKRNLAEVIRATEHEICRLIDEKELKKLISAIFFLADNNYLSLNGFNGITKEDLLQALRAAGVKEGDFLLVHSSLSVFGYLNGGAAMVIEALKEAVGSTGTFLLPLLRNTFANLGGPGASIQYRYYDKNNIDAIWTGLLPRFMLENHLETACSDHITHAWCGWGAQAVEACSAHGMNEAPCSENSPMGYALRNNGKIIHLGSRIGATTFLHYLENQYQLPGLADALCMVKGSDGLPYAVSVPDNLPGCREFYSDTTGRGKFFKAAQDRGLKIGCSQLDLGTILSMEMAELYTIGSELVQSDPFILLHDEGVCASCDHLRKLYQQKVKKQL